MITEIISLFIASYFINGCDKKNNCNGKKMFKTLKGTDYIWNGKLNEKCQPEGFGKAEYLGKHKNIKYEGNMKNGIRVGNGKYFFKNGNVYDGEWKNDNFDGNGKITYPNGDVYKGIWKEGKRVGEGSLRKPSGRVLECQNGKCRANDWFN